MVLELTPREENKSGSDFSGSNGAANRTYTLAFSDVFSSGFEVRLNGTFLHLNLDYTRSGTTLTILLNLFDSQSININYFTFTNVASTVSTAYATTLQLARFMNIEQSLPDKTLKGEARTKEEVGIGDSSTTIFYLDNAYVLTDSYTISFGSVETSVTDLTETTDYTIDKDLGKITLTAAGVTAVGTNKIFAAYSYVSIQITDSQLNDAINRAIKEIDNLTNNHFVDGTEATPDWNQFLDEKQEGQGVFRRGYFTMQNYPIPTVSTNLDGGVTASDTTITVDSTAGFPSTGHLGVESDKFVYTGKTSTTFTGVTGVDNNHDDGTVVKPYVVEKSTTDSGGTVTFTTLTEDTEFDIDLNTGRVRLYGSGGVLWSEVFDSQTSPPMRVPNRFRMSYISGTDTIPVDLTKLTLMISAKDIMSMAVRMAHSGGLNDFNPDLINVDQDEINLIKSHYRNEQYARV